MEVIDSSVEVVIPVALRVAIEEFVLARFVIVEFASPRVPERLNVEADTFVTFRFGTDALVANKPPTA